MAFHVILYNKTGIQMFTMKARGQWVYTTKAGREGKGNN